MNNISSSFYKYTIIAAGELFFGVSTTHCRVLCEASYDWHFNAEKSSWVRSNGKKVRGWAQMERGLNIKIDIFFLFQLHLCRWNDVMTLTSFSHETKSQRTKFVCHFSMFSKIRIWVKNICPLWERSGSIRRSSNLKDIYRGSSWLKFMKDFALNFSFSGKRMQFSLKAW